MDSIASLEDRFAGCLLGLAVGDALGGCFEGQTPSWIVSRYNRREQLIASPPKDPLYYTDDTQMAIGVCEALLQDREILESTLCKAFASNYQPNRGYGRGTRVILEAIEDGKDHKTIAETLFEGGSFGNGAAMRVAPVGLFFHHDLNEVWKQARLSALPTHVHPMGIEGAQLLATAVALCVSSDRFEPERFFEALISRCETKRFRQKIGLAAKVERASDLRPLGNGIEAIESVATAIGCFALTPESYDDVISRAIFLGGDTDTIAAMAGALSGAFLGINAIPSHLIQHLEDTPKGRGYLLELAGKLYEAHQSKMD